MTLLSQARRALDAVRRHDAEIDGVAERLSEATYLLSEVAVQLASDVQSLDADPARLAAVQERRAALSRIIRLYGPGGVSAHINGAPAPIDPGDWVDSTTTTPSRPRSRTRSTSCSTGRRRAAAGLGELDNDDEQIAALTAEERSWRRT